MASAGLRAIRGSCATFALIICGERAPLSQSHPLHSPRRPRAAAASPPARADAGTRARVRLQHARLPICARSFCDVQWVAARRATYTLACVWPALTHSCSGVKPPEARASFCEIRVRRVGKSLESAALKIASLAAPSAAIRDLGVGLKAGLGVGFNNSSVVR